MLIEGSADSSLYRSLKEDEEKIWRTSYDQQKDLEWLALILPTKGGSFFLSLTHSLTTHSLTSGLALYDS